MTCATRPTVLIVDDHDIWRRGLRSVLEPNFEVVAEAGEGARALDQALAHKPDVVVMDIRMPGMDGIAAAQHIKEALPDTGIVMMSAASDDEQMRRCIQAGVNGYLVKDEGPAVITDAVRCVAEGHVYLPPEVAKRVMQSVRSMVVSKKPRFDLTHREISVLRLLVRGYRTEEIGGQLGISPRTVGNHLASIYNKLGICDRTQAIVYAIKNGISRP